MIASRALDPARTTVTDERLAPHLTRDEHERVLEQSAVREIFDQGRISTVKFGQEILLETSEIIPVRVPAARALALAIERGVLFPEHRDEGHLRLDESPRHQKTHAIDSLSVALAQGEGFARDIECRSGRGRGEQGKGLFLKRVDLPHRGDLFEIPSGIVECPEESAPFVESHFAIGREAQ